MTHSDPHSQAADAVHDGRPVEAQYVRQGRRGTHVVWILTVSLVLVVAGFLAVWLSHGENFAATDSDNNKTPAEASVFASPEPAPTTKQVTAQDPTAPARGSTDAGQSDRALPPESQSTAN